MSKFAVLIERRLSGLIEVEAEDYSSAIEAARDVGLNQMWPDPKLRVDVDVVAEVGGHFSTWWDGNRSHPHCSDILVVNAPTGATFKQGQFDDILAAARSCGLSVLGGWNGTPGCDSMTVNLKADPTQDLVDKFNEALKGVPPHFARLEHIRGTGQDHG